MSNIDTDVIIDIYKTISAGPAVGSLSKWSSVPHPGTGKTIDGFLWDKRQWPNQLELEAEAFAPTIFDGTTNFIENNDFQSGIGNNEDLLLLSVDEKIVSNKDYWIPKVNHGYYYIFDDEFYAYSEDMQIQYFHSGVLFSGLQQIILKYQPKPTIPITVRRFKFDFENGSYVPDKDFRKVPSFTPLTISGVELPITDEEGNLLLSNIDQSNPEFTIDYETKRVLINGDYRLTVGHNVISSGNLTSSDDILALEQLGLSDGLSTEYNTLYSPIDNSGVFDLWVYFSPSSGEKWTQIPTLSGYDSFNPHQYKVDYELGLVLFDPDGNGQIPSAGLNIAVGYTAGVECIYEPEKSRDFILANSANTNPLNNPSEKGFIVVANTAPAANTLSLAASLPGEAPNDYVINIGNSFGTITATVYDDKGLPLEGQLVTFTILDPKFGSFGSSGSTITAITKIDGKATVFYNPPNTIDIFGKATTDVTHSGSATLINVNGLTIPNELQKVYLYQVETFDEVMGINENKLDDYYYDFLAAELIPSGSATGTAEWEAMHREADGLLSPLTYDPNNLDTLSFGAKKIVLSTGTDVINPLTGLIDPTALAPLEPLAAFDTGTTEIPSMQLAYSGLLDLPGTDNVRAYFVVANAKAQIIASVINQNNKHKIYSNTIGLDIQVPDEANGTYFATILNTIAGNLMLSTRNISSVTDSEIVAVSGQLGPFYYAERIANSGTYDGWETYLEWFRKTRRADSQILGLSGVAFAGTLPSRIPLGFRLQSTGITIASLLDMVTYFDPNSNLSAPYFSGIT